MKGTLNLGEYIDLQGEKLDGILSEGLDPEKYPVLALIVEGDFTGLYDLARLYGCQEADPGYYSRCHLCLNLRWHLHDEGNSVELKPEEFYRQLPDGS